MGIIDGAWAVTGPAVSEMVPRGISPIQEGLRHASQKAMYCYVIIRPD